MGMKRVSTGAACLLAAAVTGCTTSPADYAAMLSAQDPKWHSPQCEQMRVAAANYEAVEKAPLNWGTSILLGPYGLGLAAATRENRDKQRRLFKREMHTRCSSLPLPRELQFDPSAM